MNEILLHAFAILSVTAGCAVLYILAHRDLRKNIALPSIDNDDQDEMIKRCIKDSFHMQDLIVSATSPAELEAFYWEIEDMENSYRFLVPDQLLRDHTDRLYEAISIRKDELQMQKVRV